VRDRHGARLRRAARPAHVPLAEALPIPPLELRELVGPRDPGDYDQAEGDPVFPTVTPGQYESVLDFGCGCGRVARMLALARAPMPQRYHGIDLHRGMVQWCNDNLAPWLPNFSFEHHNVFNPGFNPEPELPRMLPFPVADDSVTLLIAVSVFTHLIEDQAEHYLDEVARVLRSDGVALTTWFLFDKSHFPMMQEFQNALYINTVDPTNAVIFDRRWLLDAFDRRGLRIRAAQPPDVRGFQWVLELEAGRGSVELPEDDAPFGRRPPPLVREGAPELGLESSPDGSMPEP
jgi:SAM-dependent methyltransferase